MATSDSTRRSFGMRSIRVRFTLVTVGILLVGIWSLTLYSAQMLREDMQHQLGDQLGSAAAILADSVDQGLTERLRALEDFTVIAEPTLSDAPSRLQALLDARPGLMAQFNAGVYVVGRDGTALAATPASTGRVGVNYMHRDDIAGALTQGRPSVSQPALGKNMRAPTLGLAVPVRDREGRIVAAVSGVIDLSRPNFLDRYGEVRYGSSSHFVVVIPDSRLIVAASDRDRALRPLEAPGVVPTLDRMLAGYEGYAFHADAQGRTMMDASRRVRTAGWSTLVSMPAEEALAPIETMLQHMRLAAIALSVLGAALIWWLLGRQMAPMLAAVKTVGNLADSGAPPVALPIVRQDEVGQLIGGFNRLLETLAQREAALAESEARFRQMFENNDSVLLLIEPRSGRIVDANASSARFYGYSVEQLRGMAIDQINTLTPEQVAAERMRAIHLERNYFIFPHRLASGETRTVVVRSTPIQVNGQVLLFSIVSDITERRRAEAELETHRHHLEQLVEARTLELAAARDAAEAANRAKTSFLANISHEIRTPLNAVVGFAGLLRHDNITPVQATRLDRIDAAAMQLLRMFDELLDVSRIEAGKLSLESSPVDVERLLNQIAALVAADAAIKGLQLAVEPMTQAMALLGDPMRLQQALLNYAANAVKFTEGGVIVLRASVQDDDAQSALVRFEVQDSGAGIAPEVLPRLFADFVQADASTSRRHGGNGLGLAITRRLAELMGGAAGAHSVPGLGSTFWFTARLVKGGPDAQVLESKPTTQPESDATCA